MHRTLACSVLTVLVVAGCGGGPLSLSEYSSEVTALIETLDGRLDAEAEEYFSQPPSIEGLQAYLEIRVDGYRRAVDGLDAIQPSQEVEQLHATFAQIMGDLLVAEEARADFADTITSVDDLQPVWDGPASQAVTAAEDKAIVLCYAAQSTFDATQERDLLSEVPWMPADLKDVINVALNCP
jgi:hypothetical protein